MIRFNEDDDRRMLDFLFFFIERETKLTLRSYTGPTIKTCSNTILAKYPVHVRNNIYRNKYKESKNMNYLVAMLKYK